MQWTILEQLEQGNEEELKKFVASVQDALERIKQDGGADEADMEHQLTDPSKNDESKNTFDGVFTLIRYIVSQNI